MLAVGLLLAGCGGGGGGDASANNGGAPAAAAVITVQPADRSTVEGGAVSFIATASNASSWQWQSSTDSGRNWSDIAAATTASYTTPATTLAMNGQQFRVTVRGATGDAVTSSSAVLVVTPRLEAAVITMQPQSITVTAGAAASFSVTATGSALAYTWQISSNGVSWTDLPLASVPTYSLASTALVDTGKQYRVQVGNSLGTVVSAAAVLTVTPAPAAPTFNSGPKDQAVASGGTAVFTVQVLGTPAPTLHWQQSDDSAATWADVPGATGSSLTLANVALSINGRRLRVVASNSSGTVTSGVAMLSVAAQVQAPAFTLQPVINGTPVVGGVLSLSARATGVPVPTLQWQTAAPGSAVFININGATRDSYVTPPLVTADHGRAWRVVASNAAGSATSAAATANIGGTPPTVAIDQGAALNPGANGQMLTLGATVTGDPVPGLQWAQSSDGNTYTAIPGATASTLIIGPIVVGFQMRYAVTATSVAGTASAFTFVSAVAPPFALSSALPVDQATSVSETGAITLNFNAAVDRLTVNASSISLATPAGSVALAYSVSGNTVQLRPVRRLAPQNLHTLSLGTAIRDIAGRALAQAATVRFTTAGATWQTAQDAGFIGCSGGSHKMAVLDDNSVIVACTASLDVNAVNTPPVWRRDGAGNWSVLARPPTSNSRTTDLSKLSGTRVALIWSDPQAADGAGSSGLQTWDTLGGLAPVFTLPFGAFIAFGADSRFIKVRAATRAELPTNAALGPAVIELANFNTGAVISSFVTELGRSAQQGFNAGCSFPSGDRLLVYATTSGASTTLDFKVWAAVHSATQGGWQAPFLLTRTSGSALNLNPVCLANGVARVFWWSTSATSPPAMVEARFADLDGISWSSSRDISATTVQLPLSPEIRFSTGRADDGPAVLTWRDLRLDAAGSIGGFGSDRYANAPRNFILLRGNRALVEDFAMPTGATGMGIDTMVRNVAFNPSTGRFVLVLYGGTVGAPRWMLTEFDPAAAWTNPWLLLPASLAAPVLQVDFNSSGNGVAIGAGPGQMMLSEWR